MDTSRACALLARTPALAAQHVLAAVAALGDVALVAEPLEAAACAALPERARAFLRSARAHLVDEDLRWAEATGARLIPCTAREYPTLLKALRGAPAVLYVLGDASTLAAPQVAMVGARAASASGRAIAHEFAAEFARCGITVTSGLAVGIDAASHEGALAAGGRTLAVCARGLARVYPREHGPLAERIRGQGVLVSELPPHTPVRPQLFARRNRIISGLAPGTLVVEAGRDSGSLITAALARQQGRAVFAVPGSIRNPLARGCHALIRAGARLVETPAEVLAELHISLQSQGVARAPTPPAASGTRAAPLDKAYEMLLDALGFEPVSINWLVERTGMPSAQLSSMLLILELEGRVAPHPGGRYCRLS